MSAKARCAAQICLPPWYLHYRQCKAKAGHGPNGNLCVAHAKKLERGDRVRVSPPQQGNTK